DVSAVSRILELFGEKKRESGGALKPYLLRFRRSAVLSLQMLRRARTFGLAAGIGTVGAGVAIASIGKRHSQVARASPATELRLFDANSDAKPMASGEHERKAIVIGAGVVGTCTAYELAKKGYKVVVIDAAAGPGQECSACAAGGMQRSNPLVNRSSWVDVLRASFPSLFSRGEDGAAGGADRSGSEPYRFFHVQWRSVLADPHFWRWLAGFSYFSLAQPREQAARQKEMLAFTDWAVDEMAVLMRRHGIAERCGYSTRGALQVLYDSRAAVRNSDSHYTSKERSTLVSLERALELEPSLALQKRLPTYGRFEPDAAMGNSEVLTRELAAICLTDPTLDVTFRFGLRVVDWVIEDAAGATEAEGGKGSGGGGGVAGGSASIAPMTAGASSDPAAVAAAIKNGGG
ncbi:unnamed protein product, partial [Phaeothamnion confervicola]